MNNRHLISIFFLLFSAFVLVGFGGSLTTVGSQKPQTQSSSVSQNQYDTVTLLSPKPLIDFSLTDTQNNAFNNTSLLKHWSLLFFGYSDCPEICPRTLALISELWRSFPNQTPHPDAQFVFVSLNATTDTPSKLKEFLNRFHPTFIGLTGSADEVNKLAKACRIYQWTDSKLDSKGNKIIDHSGTLLLINPEGKMIALFSPPFNPNLLAKELSTLMKN